MLQDQKSLTSIKLQEADNVHAPNNVHTLDEAHTSDKDQALDVHLVLDVVQLQTQQCTYIR